jgi:hypothetical protein
MTLARVVDKAFTALAEDIAAKQCQRLGQLGVLFFQLVVVRRGLIKHTFELAEAAFCVFGLLLSSLGLLLSSLGLLPQLFVAAKQVIEQPLKFPRIIGESWHDAHATIYTRALMLMQCNFDDFIRFFCLSTGALKSLALACSTQVNSREEHGQLRRLEFDAVSANCLGHLKCSDLKAFVPDGKPVAVKVEDL